MATTHELLGQLSKKLAPTDEADCHYGKGGKRYVLQVRIVEEETRNG